MLCFLVFMVSATTYKVHSSHFSVARENVAALVSIGRRSCSSR